FAPTALPYRLDGASVDGVFIDGGVFDNTPIRLADRLRPWAERDHGPGLRFLFLESDVLGWRPFTRPAARREADGVLGTYGPFLGGFVSSAREAELLDTRESLPDLWQGLEIPRRNMPAAAGFLANFFGFAEEDFRIFD